MGTACPIENFNRLPLHHRPICRQILCQIGNSIACNLHGRGGPGGAGGKLRIYTSGVVHKVGIKSGGFDLLLAEVPGQLVDNGSNHFQMSELLSSNVCKQPLQLRIWHRKTLAEVAQRRP